MRNYTNDKLRIHYLFLRISFALFILLANIPFFISSIILFVVAVVAAFQWIYPAHTSLHKQEILFPEIFIPHLN